MSQIPLRPYSRIVDLGCGAGEQAVELARRWPDAIVTGIDSSPEMLAHAESGAVRWIQADIAAYDPPEPLDLIYSNAALQWLDNHIELFPGIAGMLSDEGVLAVQMPRNHDAPSHRVMRDVARRDCWSTRFEGVGVSSPVGEPTQYHDILRPYMTTLNIWETTYLHVLKGDDPVAYWTGSTGLRPYLNALANDGERDHFFNVYKEALRQHYPRQNDGRTLFPFRRLFIVGSR